MKTIKISLVAVMLIVSQLVSAQSKSYKLYDTFSNKAGFTHFSFSRSMLDVVNIDLDEEEKTITGDLNEIRFLSYNPHKGDLNGPIFIKKAIALLPQAYDQLKLKDNEEEDIEIWMLGNKRKASEFHLFIQSEDPNGMHFLISFYGEFNLEDVDCITKIGINLSNEN